MSARRFASFVALLVGLCACSAPDSTAMVSLANPKGLNDFKPLEQAMGASCASLDCHGQPGRNLRLYDARGLRFAATDISGLGTTTPAEIAQDELSVLALEPQAIKDVLNSGGANLDSLIVVLKARGAVEHKGNAPWPEGSHGDRCLTAWLSSAKTDNGACACAVTDSSANQGDMPDPTCQ
jgi:hypothetical protein